MDLYFKLGLWIDYIIPICIAAGIFIIQVGIIMWIKFMQWRDKKDKERSDKFWEGKE